MGLSLVCVLLFNDARETQLAVAKAFPVDFALKEARLSKEEKALAHNLASGKICLEVVHTLKLAITALQMIRQEIHYLKFVCNLLWARLLSGGQENECCETGVVEECVDKGNSNQQSKSSTLAHANNSSDSGSGLTTVNYTSISSSSIQESVNVESVVSEKLCR